MAIPRKEETVGASDFFGSEGGFEPLAYDFAAIEACPPDVNLARGDGERREAGGPLVRGRHDGILMHVTVTKVK